MFENYKEIYLLISGKTKIYLLMLFELFTILFTISLLPAKYIFRLANWRVSHSCIHQNMQMKEVIKRNFLFTQIMQNFIVDFFLFAQMKNTVTIHNVIVSVIEYRFWMTYRPTSKCSQKSSISVFFVQNIK